MNMISKKISVIIPIYNSENYLLETFDCIKKQTIFSDLEIVLVNDGSTDNSQFICKEFSDKYSNVVLLNKNNGGISSARNYGLEKATGEYITFLDSDDIIEPDLYEKELIYIEENKVDLLIIDFKKEFLDETRKKYRKELFIKKWDNKKDMMCDFFRGVIGNQVVDKVFKRELVKFIEFPLNYKIGEDMHFVYNYLKICNSALMNTYISGYIYKVRTNSAMNSVFSKKFLEPVEISQYMYEENKDDIILRKYSEAHKIHEICKVIEYALKSDAKSNYSEEIITMKETIKKYSIKDAYKYLIRRQFYGYILMRFSPKIYIYIHKLMKIG